MKTKGWHSAGTSVTFHMTSDAFELVVLGSTDNRVYLYFLSKMPFFEVLVIYKHRKYHIFIFDVVIE